MIALLQSNSGVIEDALWLPEIQAKHIGNKNDPARPFSYTRLVCPWTLEPLEGEIHADAGDVEKSRGGVVIRLYPEGKPEEKCYIDTIEDPIAKSLLCLHTWANYILWLTRCTGERDNVRIWEKLSGTGTFKAFILNDEYRAIPSRFLTASPLPDALVPIQTKGLLNTPSMLCLKQMKEENISLGSRVRKTKTCGQDSWIIEESTVDPTRFYTSGVYMTAENAEKIPNGFSMTPIHVLEKHVSDDPGGITHMRYIPLKKLLGTAHNTSIKTYSPEELNAVIKRKKAADDQALEERIRNLPYTRIFEKLEALEAWNPTGKVFDRRKKVSEDTWFPGKGNLQSKTWVIGLFPSGAEMETDPPTIMVGPSGLELDIQLEGAGFDPTKDVYIDNIYRTYQQAQSKPKAAVKKEQLWAILALIMKYKPERVVAMGADAFKLLGGGTKSFTENKNLWIDSHLSLDPEVAKKLGVQDRHSFELAGIYHPAYMLKPENEHMLETFRNETKNLLLNEEVHKQEFPEIDRTDITDNNGLFQFVADVKQKCFNNKWKYRIGIDSESWNLDWTFDRLVSTQIAIRYIDSGGKNVEEENGITAACMQFLEHQEPVLRKLEEYNSSRKAVMELDLGDLSSFKPKTVENNPITREKNQPSNQGRIQKSTVVWDAASLIKADNLQEKQQCDLWIFDLRTHKEKLVAGDPTTMRLMQELCCGKDVEEVVMTNTNHDRIMLEQKLGMDLGDIHYIADTVIGEHIINETQKERGLKASVKRWLGWGPYEHELDKFKRKHDLSKLAKTLPDQYPKSAWVMLPWAVVGPYSVLDAVGTLLVREKHILELDRQVEEIQKERKENNIHNAFNISCSALYGIHEMQQHGMPVGKKGMAVLEELEEFYGRHEKNMVKEFKDNIFELTGFKNANPKSHDELGFVLFGENSPLTRLGLRPWKESGKNGRLWDEIPRDQQMGAKASTDAESLEILASNCPDPRIQGMLIRLSEIKTILTIRQGFIVTHAAAAQGKGIRGKINPRTLAMHTNYSPTLDTARCRSEPNLSTFLNNELEKVFKITGEMPPHAVRDVIQAPEGTLLLSRDWSTAEVLKLGFLSEDPNMLGTIGEMKYGQDFHARLAWQAFPQIREVIHGVEKSQEVNKELIYKAILNEECRIKAEQLWNEHWAAGGGTMQEGKRHKFIKNVFPELRQNAKPVTFGVPYGRTFQQIHKELNRQYFIDDVRTPDGKIATVGLDAAEAMVTGYKEEFSVAWQYLLDQATQAEETGFLQDRWGYIRHFPKGMNPGDRDRKAYNYQIQHGVAVLMNQAMGEWSQIRRKEKLKSYAFYTLYDGIGWVTYPEEMQRVWDISNDVMTRNRPVCPDGKASKWYLPTDGKFSTAWASGFMKAEELGINENKEFNITGL